MIIRRQQNFALDIIMLIAVFFALFSSGCYSTRHTHTASTQAVPAGTTTTTIDPATGTAVTTSGTNTVQSQTTTTTTEEPERHSLFGGIFYAVGEVVAFPFRLIGGIFDAIF